MVILYGYYIVFMSISKIIYLLAASIANITADKKNKVCIASQYSTYKPVVT